MDNVEIQECVFESQGLRVILESFESNSRLCSIVDFACPTQETLDILSKQHTIYTVINLFKKFPRLPMINGDSASDQQDPPSLREIADLLDLRLRHPPDLILTWDYFNYIPRPFLVQLMSYISKTCVKGTLLHSISWVHRKMPRTVSSCSFVSKELFRMQYENHLVDSPSHSAQNLNTMIPSFKIDKVSMHSLGFIEVVMKYDEFRESPNPHLII